MWLLRLIVNFVAVRYNVIVLDCEIKKLIPEKGKENLTGYEYCKKWTDFMGMGLSCCCVYDFKHDTYHVFLEDNLDELQALVDRRTLVIGHNIKTFDNLLLAANGVIVPPDKTWDSLCESWSALGMPEVYTKGSTPSNLKLSDFARCNLTGQTQQGHGSAAPKLFQNGNMGSLLNYCLQDVKDSVSLLKIILRTGQLINPNGGTIKYNTKRFPKALRYPWQR